MLNPIKSHFAEVKEPRTGQNIGYPLDEILLVSVITLLTGGETYEEMRDTGRAKLPLLREFFPFKKGIPSEDTFRYVFMLLNPKELGDCFARWMSFLHEHVQGLVAIDGKACRGSAKKKGKSPVNIVNAYCRERGVVLACIDTPDKSNEITVLPDLLRMLDIKGCVVTLDAMGCQKKVAAQIVQQKGDYLIALKGNQGSLHRDVREFFEAHEQTSADFKEPDFEADVFECQENSHGRHYRRRIVVTSDFCGGLSAYRKKWKGFQSAVRVQSWRTENDKTTCEVRYYITTLPADAKHIADVIRGHWSVENNAHWMLDVYFGEDASRVRAGHSAKNLATLRRLALNILRHAQKELANRRSVRRMIRSCAMEDDFLKIVLRRGLKLHATSSKPA